MNILISNSDKRPIYEQILIQIKDLILKEKIKSGDQLPSIRVLAKELRISVITTKRAYDELEKEGFVETVPGKGTFVTNKNMELIREESIKKMEALLIKGIKIGRQLGYSVEDLIEVFKILNEEV